MKIKTFNENIRIEIELSKADLMNLIKFNKDVLTKRDEDGKAVFKVCPTKRGDTCISLYGVECHIPEADNVYPYVEVKAPTDCTDVKEWLFGKYGNQLKMLKDFEPELQTEVRNISAMITDLKNCVETV